MMAVSGAVVERLRCGCSATDIGASHSRMNLAGGVKPSWCIDWWRLHSSGCRPAIDTKSIISMAKKATTASPTSGGLLRDKTDRTADQRLAARTVPVFSPKIRSAKSECFTTAPARRLMTSQPASGCRGRPSPRLADARAGRTSRAIVPQVAAEFILAATP